jgi:hypothetical protein
MKYLKKVGIALVVICVISIWVYLSARSDYTWANLIIEQETSKGQTLITKSDNFTSLTVPWTFFKTPVTGLWFCNKTNTKKLNQEIYLMKILYVSYDYKKTEKDEYWIIINIKNKESFIMDSEQELNNINFSKLKWRKYETGSPGFQIIEYIINYDKNP